MEEGGEEGREVIYSDWVTIGHSPTRIEPNRGIIEILKWI